MKKGQQSLNTLSIDKGKAGISVVVPFLNESEVIEQFCSSMDAYSVKLSLLLELIFVDEGSSDDTVEKLKGYKWENIKRVKVVSLSKNYGSHAALRAGIQHASYDICTWMGSDGQDPKEMLQTGYRKLTDEGYDAVYIDKESVVVSQANRLFSKINFFGARSPSSVFPFSKRGIIRP